MDHRRPVQAADRRLHHVRDADGKLLRRARRRARLVQTPVWAYKQLGTWGVDGGAGYTVVHQIGYRSFPYGGFLVQKNVNGRLDASIEVFSHAREGFATAQTEASMLIDAGFAYHFKSPGLQLLLAYGHSVAGQTENYVYLGLYKTWGKNKGTKGKSVADAMQH